LPVEDPVKAATLALTVAGVFDWKGQRGSRWLLARKLVQEWRIPLAELVGALVTWLDRGRRAAWIAAALLNPSSIPHALSSGAGPVDCGPSVEIGIRRVGAILRRLTSKHSVATVADSLAGSDGPRSWKPQRAIVRPRLSAPSAVAIGRRRLRSVG
jgi:hypothetical protein